MENPINIALVGEYSDDVIAHQAINKTFELLQNQFDVPITGHWLPTDTISSFSDLEPFDGIWVVPASPYKSLEGALTAIQYARTQQVPFFGSCGGFQHAIMEYCLNVLGWKDTGHAEIDNGDSHRLVISALACSLVEESETLTLKDEAILNRVYQQENITESYHCNYGINPEYLEELFASDLNAVAHNADSDIRAIELTGHPFFVATLFQPERSAAQGNISPIVQAFVKSAQSFHNDRA